MKAKVTILDIASGEPIKLDKPLANTRFREKDRIYIESKKATYIIIDIQVTLRPKKPNWVVVKVMQFP